MKVITLVPVKNEAWILKFSLKNFSLFSDEIIVLNDKSIDESVDIIKSFPKAKIVDFNETENIVDMSRRRNILLEAGREAGGTHFLFLDADEILSENFVRDIKQVLSNLSVGQTVKLPWVTITENKTQLYFEEKEKEIYKDFIFCDDKVSNYKKQNLSEARTPGIQDNIITIPFQDGYVIHFQYLASERNKVKQAWYRMNELLQNKRSAARINATYEHTKRRSLKKGYELKDSFVEENRSLIETNVSAKYHLDQIIELFKKYGIRKFEHLDIWDMADLREIFKKELGREPKPKTFPNWILFLNNIKNKIRNELF
jgi:glycosyltransferase involved in cell wall biosynthesis